MALSGSSDCRCFGHCTISNLPVALDFAHGLEVTQLGCMTTFSEGSFGMLSWLPDGGPGSRSILKCSSNCRAFLFHGILLAFGRELTLGSTAFACVKFCSATASAKTRWANSGYFSSSCH